MLRMHPDKRTKKTISQAGVSGRKRPQPAEPEEAQKGPRNRPHEHRAEARREGQKTGLQWAHSEPDLKEKRQQERHGVETHSADAADNRADAEGADAQQS